MRLLAIFMRPLSLIAAFGSSSTQLDDAAAICQPADVKTEAMTQSAAQRNGPRLLGYYESRETTLCHLCLPWALGVFALTALLRLQQLLGRS